MTSLKSDLQVTLLQELGVFPATLVLCGSWMQAVVLQMCWESNFACTTCNSVTLLILGETKFIHEKSHMKPYKIDKTAQEAA